MLKPTPDRPKPVVAHSASDSGQGTGTLTSNAHEPHASANQNSDFAIIAALAPRAMPRAAKYASTRRLTSAWNAEVAGNFTGIVVDTVSPDPVLEPERHHRRR